MANNDKECSVSNFEERAFSKHKSFYIAALVALLIAGFLVRMIDLKDAPLDFHPTRQLRGAIIARNLYLRVNPGANPEIADFATNPALFDFVGRLEPPITEAFVVLGYLIMGGETLWVSRIVTSFFWCLGGIGLYLLVKKLTSKDAGLICLGFYLFNQFGVIGSRSFQPESLMVASMIWALWFFMRWLEERSWKAALAAGLVSGFSILVKPNPVFFLSVVYLLLLITSDGFLTVLKNIQVWVIAALTILFPLVYFTIFNPGAGGFLDSWWKDTVNIVPTSRYFLGWGSIMTDVIPFAVLVIAFASTLLMEKSGRYLSIGMWVGYVIFGLFLPHHIHTHDYYSIVLVPISAIALAKVAQIVAEFASGKERIWKIGLILLAVIAILYPTWNVYKTLNDKDYRGEPGGWAQISEAIPADASVIALTHNYGENVAYYSHRMVSLWPSNSEVDFQALSENGRPIDFDTYFNQKTEPFDFFLVTLFGEFNAQPMLMERLSEFQVHAEGPGFIVYDLSSK